MSVTLGITDSMGSPEKFRLYTAWLLRAMPDASLVTMSCTLGNASALGGCDGLVVTGGDDVHPRFYGREDALSACVHPNEDRDTFEIGVIRTAVQAGLPLLGICRGLQITNVALGGTLIPDIEAAGYPTHRRGEPVERRHDIHVEGETLLGTITGTPGGNTNTFHHQAADRPGSGLRVSARSTDGIIEALEWERPGQRAFLLLVQWHPERMKDTDNPFCGAILDRFAREVGTASTRLHHA